MRDPGIVAIARAPIGRAYRDTFNATAAPTLGAMSIAAAVERAGLEGGEVVAKRYSVSREVCDEFAFQSRQRTVAAQAAGRFDAEIVPATATMTVTVTVTDKATGETSQKEVTLTRDEGNRADTTLEGLNAHLPVMPEGIVTAGNASQLSDGSAAAWVPPGCSRCCRLAPERT